MISNISNNSMSILSPSVVPLSPSKKSKPFPPFPSLKKKQPSRSLKNTRNLPLLQNPHPKTIQSPPNSIISAPNQIHEVLLDDWPQLLQISIGSKDFKLGLSIHALVIKLGSENQPFKGNNLINLYSKFNRLNDAEKVFDDMAVRNAITWSSLINGYSQSNDVESVFRIAVAMIESGEPLCEHICTSILRACESPRDQVLGQQIHCLIIKSGFARSVFVGTSLLSMYMRNGFLDNAEKVFQDLEEVDIQCLNSMILGFAKEGNGEEAIRVFGDVLENGFEPTEYTFSNVISACSGNIGVEEGKQVHGLAFKLGCMSALSVGNALLTMYAKNGLVKEAEEVFFGMGQRDLFSWTALLSSYAKHSNGQKAIDGFLKMLHSDLGLDSKCLTTVVDACSECKNLNFGFQMHGLVMKLGYLSDVFLGTALIDMYAKCGYVKSAKLVLKHISAKNVASFNAVLVGGMEVDEGEEEDSMGLFSRLRFTGMEPNSLTFARLLSLSADQASLPKGKSLHALAIKLGHEAEITVSNSLISMYAKCGSIGDARGVFQETNNHDLVTWNTMVSGFSLHGQGKEALLLFHEMEREGFVPDGRTILAVMQACSYSGLFEDGFRLFETMESRLGIKPIIEHYASMVDLLGRSGNLSKAMDFIKGSPFANSPMLWRTLVNASKIQGDLSFSRIASQHLLDLIPDDAGSYILVSNVFTDEGMLDDAAKVRTLMNDRKIKKEAGCSWIEVENKVHRFFASGSDHPESKEIYQKLHELRSLMELEFDANAEPFQTTKDAENTRAIASH